MGGVEEDGPSGALIGAGVAVGAVVLIGAVVGVGFAIYALRPPALDVVTLQISGPSPVGVAP